MKTPENDLNAELMLWHFRFVVQQRVQVKHRSQDSTPTWEWGIVVHVRYWLTDTDIKQLNIPEMKEQRWAAYVVRLDLTDQLVVVPFDHADLIRGLDSSRKEGHSFKVSDHVTFCHMGSDKLIRGVIKEVGHSDYTTKGSTITFTELRYKR